MPEDLAAADPTSDADASKWGRYGRRPALVLAGVGFVDAVDRGILAGVLVQVQADLGVSDVQLGLLDTAYVVAGLLIAVPAGYLADHGRRTRIIGVVLASWAAISAATAAAANFGQLFLARAALGVGETVDDPAARSLVCDYYPARIRSRVFSYLSATPSMGKAVGIALGGAVAAGLGWRWAFLLVGVPGSLLALAVWRLPEPQRGEADGLGEDPLAAAPVRPVAASMPAARSLFRDWTDALRVPSLRTIVAGLAVTSGSLTGIAFWATAYHQRHSGMSPVEASSITGALILLGVILGALVGGRMGDRARRLSPAAPLWYAGAATALGALFIFASVQEGLPIWGARVPLQVIAVGLLISVYPPTNALIGEVTPAHVRGTAFSLSRLALTSAGAVSPPVFGWLAMQRPVGGPGGVPVGDLGFAFAASLPLLLLGAVLLAWGGRTVRADAERALRAA